MKKQFAVLFGIGILNLVLFFGVFTLLQSDKIYQHTLGKISQNYERTGSWGNYEIKKVTKPYTALNNENLLRWDAVIYECLSNNMYTEGETCYGNVRAAFFPLFPVFWRLSGASPIGISLVNYLVFIASMAFLFIHLFRGKPRDRLPTFAVLITLPSAIIYYIPYTEAFFLLTMTIAAIGIIKEKYGVYVIGALLMATVRPATAFVLLAILAVELALLIRNKQMGLFFKRATIKAVPFLIGYLIVILIQYIYSGSWTAYLDAQKFWAGSIQGIKGISDWSVEGFGMNVFAIFFVAIPALLFAIYSLATFKSKEGVFSKMTSDRPALYLLMISVFYLAGIFVFTLITSGGNLHSFFRFTLASPFFYIAVLICLNELPRISSKLFAGVFVVFGAFLFLFLHFTAYGGEVMQFSFLGLFLSALAFLYLGIRKSLSKLPDGAACILIAAANIVWNTYLFNHFLSDGWIFT
ncbi:MAG: hypothetical protein ABR574_13260 [Cryomorphaceae bacterium]|nr:hypothetical protein [Flavobacteriales bacterium]